MARGRHQARRPSKLFRTLHSGNENSDTTAAPSGKRRNLAIQQYLKTHTPTGTLPDWTQCPEVPTLENLFETVDEEVVNLIDQPWPSKLEYLKNQYLLLREDALRPLRHVVKVVQDSPHMPEDSLLSNLGIYDHVHVCGAILSTRGLATKVNFSLGRVGKNVHWEQSKRLLTGSLVVLMSAENKDVCKLGVVAARPLVGLAKTPPEIDLFFFRAEDIDIDCQQEWIMIEERSTFFEAQRHTLLALQRLTHERFPLSEYIVDLETSVDPPPYLSPKRHRDLSSIFRSSGTESFANVDVLNDWPKDPQTVLDNSQQMALKRILTKKISIVQGPPGTGKTFVSVQALKAMLDNLAPGDPPTIVACQTNHALDQLLRHVAMFEPMFARLGGRSKDTDVIKKRTVYELRQQVKIANSRGFSSIKRLGTKIVEILRPLSPEQEMIELSHLQEHGILTEAQCDSLEKNADEWVSQDDIEGEKSNPLKKWLGSQIKPRKTKMSPLLIDFEDADDDLNYEDIQEQEAETAMAGVGDEDEQYEMLRGDFVEIGDKWTGSGAYVSDFSISETLRKNPDLRKIPSTQRGIIYQYLQRKVKESISKKLRGLFTEYMDAVQERKIANLEVAEMILRDQRIVGLTTTGLAKYRSLISSLKPKVMLIEEAAETLEAPVVAACVESLEHLILVGDHKQLRPHCNVGELENPPYNLNISLFERLVQNQVEFSLLNQQRRMAPEIRRLLRPIYGDVILDHPDVHERAPVPGMGKLSTWFFTHQFPDERDSESSSLNAKEAEMIVGLVQYLSYNGVEGKDITILTFYNGQRRYLGRLFGRSDFWKERLRHMRIATVDSYQGEENGVVLLSLVRSNDQGKIGFVGVDNRVCVAMSRAQRGLYVFGNGELLCGESKIWLQIIRMLKWGYNTEHPQRRRIGFTIPLQCTRHGRKHWIRHEGDWAYNVGGCNIVCNTRLACGHVCRERCHPWDHSVYACKFPCDKLVPGCGHKCFQQCFEQCWCTSCEKRGEVVKRTALAEATAPQRNQFKDAPDRPASPKAVHPGVSKWKTFADGGVEKHDRELARKRELKESNAQLRQIDDQNSRLLFDDGSDAGGTATGDQATLISSTAATGGNVRHHWHQKYEVGGKSGLESRMEITSLLDAPIPGEEASMAVGADVGERRPKGPAHLLDGAPPPAEGGWDRPSSNTAGMGWDAAPSGGWGRQSTGASAAIGIGMDSGTPAANGRWEKTVANSSWEAPTPSRGWNNGNAEDCNNTNGSFKACGRGLDGAYDGNPPQSAEPSSNDWDQQSTEAANGTTGAPRTTSLGIDGTYDDSPPQPAIPSPSKPSQAPPTSAAPEWQGAPSDPTTHHPHTAASHQPPQGECNNTPASPHNRLQRQQQQPRTFAPVRNRPPRYTAARDSRPPKGRKTTAAPPQKDGPTPPSNLKPEESSKDSVGGWDNSAAPGSENMTW